MATVAFFHGWAFDATFWGPINLGPNWQTFVFDRGYFGEQRLFPNLESVDLIIAHSYGLHWIPDYLLKSCKGIIAINSFRKFVPDHPLESVRTRRVLQKMIHQFQKSPYSVLEQFYTLVFSPKENSQPLPEFIHHSLLLHDLISMETKAIEINPLLKDKKWLILTGEHDTIVTQASKNDWNGFATKQVLIKDGTHVLWKTHIQDTVLAIRSWLTTSLKK